MVNHIAEIITPYTEAGADWHSLRAVQGLELSMLLHGSVAPQALQVLELPTADQFADFEFNPAAFQDGPYLDPPPNAIATTSTTSGVIQLTVGYNLWVDTMIYGFGVPVSYNGQDYISKANGNAGNIPSPGSFSWQALPLGSSISPQGFVQTDAIHSSVEHGERTLNNFVDISGVRIGCWKASQR